MLLPNKIYTYNESVLSKLPPVLKVIKQNPISVLALYKEVGGCITSTDELINTLDCLYALHKIEYDDKKEVLRYVARDTE